MNRTPPNDEAQIPAIEFRHVSLSFGEKTVLSDISFKLGRNQMICVTGASGAGKSLLLRLAIGLIRPNEGEIFVNGREIEGLGEDELLAIRGGTMGIVFQEDALFTGLTVYENVAYRLAEHGWGAPETERAGREALRFVGLEDEIDKLPEELSGGMKRRLEIARALVGWPSIMLFDEPTSGLDPLNEGQVLDLVILARDVYHTSSLFVTKQIHQIPYLATHRAVEEAGGHVVREAQGAQAPDLKVLFLQDGRIGFLGTAEEFAETTDQAVARLDTAHERGAFNYV